MKDSEKVFQDLKQDISTYVELKLELLKLNTYERVGKVIALLSYGLILIFLVFFAVLFIFLALGLFLGEILDMPSAGFAIVSIFYLLIIWLITANKNKIHSKIQNILIAALTANEEKSKTNEDSQSTTDTSGEIVG